MPAKISKKNTSAKTPKITTIFTLENISAVQTILACYTPTPKKPLSFVEGDRDDKDTLPQTVVADLDVDISNISVTDLLHERSKRVYYFVDTRKTQIKIWCNMVDVLENKRLPTSTNRSCWWCRHQFYFRPIGCPLRYSTGDQNPKMDKMDTFYTEGYFCSFPCCEAYILSQNSNIKYKDSASLLSLLAYNIYGSHVDFPVAPTWKLLKEYGGHLGIQEFRASIGQLEYTETVNMRNINSLIMASNSQYISEKRTKTFRDR